MGGGPEPEYGGEGEVNGAEEWIGFRFHGFGFWT